ncbi:hypothetical protein LOK49_LG15G01125 [Camellia lanceoleosa]|uniref:Uncharacterized protein n=1 Tax=Camellia lanceoleosa TaxID=1840588 RepID=A0ACC0F178_9ERIC|nr:hypothetical protein LOK49_LG15G01125 [Camellia lanceoleosa]
MCPLRLILIFLSATLAAFFVLKNIKYHSEIPQDSFTNSVESSASVNPSSKVSKQFVLTTDYSLSIMKLQVWGAIRTGFCTFIDMASDLYLWWNFVSSSSSSSSSSSEPTY